MNAIGASSSLLLATDHGAPKACLARLLGGPVLALAFSAAVAAQGFRLNPALVLGGDVAEFQLAPDGSRVVYRADQDVDGVFELYSVALDGGAPIRLNGPLAVGGSVGLDFLHNFRIGPDGSRVLYWADQDEDEVFELFSVPIDGSQAPVQLNGPLVPGGDVLFTPSFLPAEAFAPMTSDGRRVLYVADQEQDEVFELYSAPADGSQPAVKLNAALVPGGNVVLSTPPFGPNPIWPQVSPDGSSAVYRADQETDDVIELYGVPLDGSRPPVKLNRALGPGGDVFSARVSPDGRWVLYVASLDPYGPAELFRVPLRGTAARARRTDDRDRLSLHLDPSERVSGVSISPDGSRVVYQANPSGGDSDQVFSVPLLGGPSSALSLLGDGPVAASLITSDGARVVYLAGVYESFNSKLFSVPIDASANRIQISTLAAIGAVGGFELTPDARRAVYAIAPAAGVPAQIHGVPIDGSASPVRLSPLGTTTGPFRISRGDAHVVFLQRSFPAGVTSELYAAPLDGSEPARRLNAPLVSGGNVGLGSGTSGLALTSTGRVVYGADQEQDEVFELFESFLERPHRRAP